MTESSRTIWGLVWLERLWQDVRTAAARWPAARRSPIIAVLSLAIGIGANCAIFSFADALLLRPLPVARPGEVLTVGSTSGHRSVRRQLAGLSYRDYVDIRDRSKSLRGTGRVHVSHGRVRR